MAIALRNRWRRQQLPPELAEDIAPKNILMIGPTGVGKTEIARRLARLAKAPFLKVEASKFTEVGYVGRDVESMVRDLVEIAVTMVKEEKREAVREAAEARAEDRLLQLLVPPRPINAYLRRRGRRTRTSSPPRARSSASKLRAGALDNRRVEIEVDESSVPSLEMFTPQGVEEVGINIKDMLPGLFGRKKKQQVLGRRGARDPPAAGGREADRPRPGLPRGAPARRAGGHRSSSTRSTRSPAARGAAAPTSRARGCSATCCRSSRGRTSSTKYGMVKTDHILFIAAGAFHVSKPSDLIPELQGRFPIRVELDALTEQDFVRILTEPETALTKQYSALLSTEGVHARVHRRRGGRARPPGRRGQLLDREHRRPPALDADGAPARRGLLRGPRHGGRAR